MLEEYTTRSTVEPIEAWRLWRVDELDKKSPLRSWSMTSHKLKSWPAGRRNEAICSGYYGSDPHHWKVPHINHGCGLYGSLRPSRDYRLSTLTVKGRVYLWGRVIRHEKGWRAQFAYPKNFSVEVGVLAGSNSTRSDKKKLVEDLLQVYHVPIFLNFEDLKDSEGTH